MSQAVCQDFDHTSFFCKPNNYLKFQLPSYMGEHVFRMVPHGLEIKPHAVQQIQSRSHILLDTTTDQVTLAGLKQRYDLIETLGFNDRVTWITDDLQAPDFYSNALCWPRDLACSSVRAEKRHPMIATDELRSVSVSCLNRMFRPHRAYLVHRLWDSPYFADMMITHRAYINSYTNQPMDLSHHWFTELPKLAMDIMSQQDLYLVDRWGNNQGLNDHAYLHPAYTDSYLNIVTESTVDPGVYFTEKTFKPLAAGQLFLMVGNQNATRYLRDLGIECFWQDLGNHSYEQSENWIERIDDLIQLLTDIYHNIPDIYWKNIREIRHNQSWILSDAFRQVCEKNLRSRGVI